jgi:isoquinoline 1-oxidoreductase beta subunit
VSGQRTGAGLSRRGFIVATGSATASLLLGFHVAPRVRAGTPAAPGPRQLNSFLRIDPDNTITVLMNHSEFGNGAYTSLSMMVAEELDADWERIKLEAAPTRPEYYSPIFGEYLTAGSVTTGGSWLPMRTAGAQARAMVLEAAARLWAADRSALTTRDSEVIWEAGGKRASYGELVAVIQREDIQPPAEVALKAPAQFTLLGKPRRRIEGHAKVDGSAVFGIDIKLPGMLYGSVARCPVYGGRVRSYDDTAALAIDGVVKAKPISSGVVVLARDYWTARKGRDALKVEWDEGPNAALSSDGFYREYRQLAEQPGMLAENIGDAVAALERAGQEKAGQTLEATYEMPYLAHATMEPMNATAIVREDGCEIWSGTQYQSNDQEIVAALLDLPQDRVIIHRPLMGGTFGRRASKTADFTVDAVEAARGESVPVQVIWSREEDIRGGHYRPLFVHRMRGALDGSGMPLAWFQTVVGQSIMQHTKHDPAYMVDGMDIYSLDGCLQEPFGVFPYGTCYTIPNHRIESHNAPKVGVRPHEWRCVGQTHTGIAYECFLDEMAIAGGRDPLDLRIELSKQHPRMNRLLRAIRDRSDWDRPLAEGRGRGVAARVYSVSPIAQVAEVTVHDNGEFSVDRVVCVVDCGFAVNPLNIEAQVQGGVALGLGAVAAGNIDYEAGRIVQSNFHDYRPLRINQMPQVEVHILPSDQPPTGVGEQATAPIAPAVANAIYSATGRRIRSFPLAKHGLTLV